MIDLLRWVAIGGIVVHCENNDFNARTYGFFEPYGVFPPMEVPDDLKEALLNDSNILS